MRRLRLADDLVVTHDGHLVTVASQRWDPGTFVYDVAFLRVETVPGGDGLEAKVWHEGRYAPHQLLRFPVPAGLATEFAALVAEVAAARSALG